MALERGTFGFGAAVYPLAASLSNTLLQDADPAVFWAIDFWRTVLETHVGPRWSLAVSDAGRPDLASQLVQQVATFNPVPYLKRDQFKFPLLAVYRMSEARDNDRTIAWTNVEATWGVQLILPPVSPSQREKVNPVLKAFRDVLYERTTNQADPSYRSGQVVWSQLAKVEMIGFAAADFRDALGTDDLVFPCCTLRARVTERTQPVTGAYDQLSGEDVEIDVDKGTGSTAPLTVKVGFDVGAASGESGAVTGTTGILTTL